MAKISKIYEKVETKACKHVTDVEMEVAKSDDNKYLISTGYDSLILSFVTSYNGEAFKEGGDQGVRDVIQPLQ